MARAGSSRSRRRTPARAARPRTCASSCSRAAGGCGPGPRSSFPPPSPPYTGATGDAFVPFGIGYVELPGEVKVEARLTEADPERLREGMEMELVVVPFRTDDKGNEVVTFAFRPVG